MTLEHKLKKIEEAAKKLDEAIGCIFEAGTLLEEVKVEIFSSNKKFLNLRNTIGEDINLLKEVCSDLRIKGE